MSIGTRLYTWLKGELVGTDGAGNRYYRARGGKRSTTNPHREQRWVIYASGMSHFGQSPDASHVPAAWHAWMHHYADAPPSDGKPQRRWQKEHVPNLTGTARAYRPPGHDLEGGRRASATGDYEPWTPN